MAGAPETSKSKGRLVSHLAGWRDQALCSSLVMLRPLSCCLLQTWQSTILVVSHDRNFLNAVATDIIHLHSQRLDTYRGDFENFMKIKEERLKNQQREYEAQQQYREHIQVLGEARSAGALSSQPCPFLRASRPMDVAVVLQEVWQQSGVPGAERDLGLSEAFLSFRFSSTAFATTPTGRPKCRASSSSWRSCECLSCSSLAVGKGQCSWEDTEVPRVPGCGLGFGCPVSGPEALSSMRCPSAEDSTWASGVGVDPQCKASWLCVSSCRPELKPVDKEYEVIMK